jgi:hypothetical protein
MRYTTTSGISVVELVLHLGISWDPVDINPNFCILAEDIFLVCFISIA